MAGGADQLRVRHQHDIEDVPGPVLAQDEVPALTQQIHQDFHGKPGLAAPVVTMRL